MSFKGKKNLYACMKCGSAYVTVDQDFGVTPFFTCCDQEKCDGIAKSMGYAPDPALQNTKAKYVWRLPLAVELAHMKRHETDHASKGGLFMAYRNGALFKKR